MQTDATTHKVVGPTMLGVVSGVHTHATTPNNVGTRFSQSPSLLNFGSGSWPPALALSLAFAAENITNLPLALRARKKNLSSIRLGKSMRGPEVLRGKDTTR